MAPSKSGDCMVFGAPPRTRNASAARRGRKGRAPQGPARDGFTLEGRGAADTLAVPTEARLHPKTGWFLVERGAHTQLRIVECASPILPAIKEAQDGHVRISDGEGDGDAALKPNDAKTGTHIIAHRPPLSGMLESTDIGFNARKIALRHRGRSRVGNVIIQGQKIGPRFGRQDDRATFHGRSFIRLA